MQYPRSNQTSRPRTFLRRIVTVSAQTLGAVLVVVTLPALIVLAALIDVLFRRWRFGTVRIVGFLLWYLLLGTVIQLVGLAIWVLTLFGTRSQTPRARGWNYRLVDLWINNMLRGLHLTVGLRLEVDHPELATGQVVVVSRHQSLADVYVPTGIAVSVGSQVRVVVTSGLLNEPSLDLFGNRTSHYWLERKSTDMRAELDAVARLGASADDKTALIIFPEGALFREAQRKKVLESLEKRDPVQAERGRRLQRLLPARAAGFSALLDGAPEADIVIVGHVGFEQLTDPVTIWRSVPLERSVLVRVARYERASLPDDVDGRQAWLNDRWDDMDAWIGENLRATAGGDRDTS